MTYKYCRYENTFDKVFNHYGSGAFYVNINPIISCQILPRTCQESMVRSMAYAVSNQFHTPSKRALPSTCCLVRVIYSFSQYLVDDSYLKPSAED